MGQKFLPWLYWLITFFLSTKFNSVFFISKGGLCTNLFSRPYWLSCQSVFFRNGRFWVRVLHFLKKGRNRCTLMRSSPYGFKRASAHAARPRKSARSLLAPIYILPKIKMALLSMIHINVALFWPGNICYRMLCSPGKPFFFLFIY